MRLFTGKARGVVGLALTRERRCGGGVGVGVGVGVGGEIWRSVAAASTCLAPFGSPLGLHPLLGFGLLLSLLNLHQRPGSAVA